MYAATCSMRFASSSLSCGLACLAQDRLLDVLDAFALVGLGRPKAADLRRRRAERLAIDPREDQEVLVHLGRDPLGQLVLDRVRIAERQDDLGALDLGLV